MAQDYNYFTELPQLEPLSEFYGPATAFYSALKYNHLTKVVEQIRRNFVNHADPPVDELVKTGIVPSLIKLLDSKHFIYEKLVNECAWIIAIMTGVPTYVDYLLQFEIISRAINCFDHLNEEIKDNAIWILANIAGDSFRSRDQLLEQGIATKLANMLNDKSFSAGFVSHVTWLISNLCRGKPYPPFSQTEPFLRMLQFFVKGLDHDETLKNSMWALSYLSDGDCNQIESILDLDITDRIMELTGSNDVHIASPALRIVGNLLTGNDVQTEEMIYCGVIPCLASLLNHPRKVFRKEACWGLSNIAAGSVTQVRHIFIYNDKEIIRKLFQMAYNDTPDVVKECIFCLTNTFFEEGEEFIQSLVDLGIIDLFIETLKKKNSPDYLEVILEGLTRIFEFGEKLAGEANKNPYIIGFKDKNGLEVLEELQCVSKRDNLQLISNLIENYLE